MNMELAEVRVLHTEETWSGVFLQIMHGYGQKIRLLAAKTRKTYSFTGVFIFTINKRILLFQFQMIADMFIKKTENCVFINCLTHKITQFHNLIIFSGSNYLFYLLLTQLNAIKELFSKRKKHY